MKNYKYIGKKLAGAFFAMMLVSSLVFSSSASAARTTTKAMMVNTKRGTAQIIRDTRKTTWTTAFGSRDVTCKVSGTYDYMRTESGSVSSGSIKEQSKEGEISISKNLNSGYVFTYAKGIHKASCGSGSVKETTSV